MFAIVLLLVAFLPWWLTLIVLIGLAVYFPMYLEIIFFGFLFDNLYLASAEFPYRALLLTTIILVVISLLRKHIRK